MKDIYINPDDKSSTLLAKASGCCGGHHQTIAGALLKSKYWKAWYLSAERKGWDVCATEDCGIMSDEHFEAFIQFVISKYYFDFVFNEKSPKEIRKYLTKQGYKELADLILGKPRKINKI